MSNPSIPQTNKPPRFYDPIEKFLLQINPKLVDPWRAVKWCTLYASIAGLAAVGSGEIIEPITLTAIASSVFVSAFGAQWLRNTLRYRDYNNFGKHVDTNSLTAEQIESFSKGCDAQNSYLLTARSFLPYAAANSEAFRAGQHSQMILNEGVLSGDESQANCALTYISSIVKFKQR